MASINAYDQINYSPLNLPTLQDMMVAPAYLTEQHQAMEDKASELMSEAEKVKMAAMENPDGVAYKRYSEYTNRLNQAVDSLSKQGVNKSGIRPTLGKIRAAYNAEIAPIGEAWELKKQDEAALNKLKMTNPSLIIADDPTQRTVDSYLQRGNTSYVPNYVSGDKITQDVANAMKPISQYIAQTKPELIKSNLPFQYFTAIQEGASLEDVQAAMQRDGFDPNSASQMTNMIRTAIDGVLEANGVNQILGNNPEGLQRAMQYANVGAYQALGSKKFGNMSDPYGMKTALIRDQLGALKGKEDSPYPYITPRAKVSFNEKEMKKVLELKKLLKGVSNNKTNSSSYIPTGQGLILATNPYIKEPKYTDEYYHEIYSKLGLDPKTTSKEELSTILDSMKDNSVLSDKVYDLDPTRDKYAVDYLNSKLTSRAASGTMIKNPEGRMTDQWFNAKAYDVDKGSLKPGFFYQKRGDSWGVVNSNENERFYPIDVEQLDMNLLISQHQLGILKEAEKNKALSYIKSLPDSYFEELDLTREEYLKGVEEQIESKFYQKGTKSEYSNFSVRNKENPVKP